MDFCPHATAFHTSVTMMLISNYIILIGVIFSAQANLQKLEKRVEHLEEQLEHGGKHYQSISYSMLTMWATIMF